MGCPAVLGFVILKFFKWGQRGLRKGQITKLLDITDFIHIISTITGCFASGNFAAAKFAARNFRCVEISQHLIFAAPIFDSLRFLP